MSGTTSSEAGMSGTTSSEAGMSGTTSSEAGTSGTSEPPAKRLKFTLPTSYNLWHADFLRSEGTIISYYCV